jgi:hypothetical protein
MNNILKAILILLIFSCTAFGQTKNKNNHVHLVSLVGVWQFGDPRVGNGLNQNFEFYSNGKFIFHVGKIGDDLVSTTQIKGKYRLLKDSLFFTFTSRVILIGGKIGTVDHGLDYGIFEFEGAKQKEILETNPKEDIDPTIITIISKNHIKINNEDYYKIDPLLLKEQHLPNVQ